MILGSSGLVLAVWNQFNLKFHFEKSIWFLGNWIIMCSCTRLWECFILAGKLRFQITQLGKVFLRFLMDIKEAKIGKWVSSLVICIHSMKDAGRLEEWFIVFEAEPAVLFTTRLEW
ncbi:hypothetical protein ACH5RR_023548 [Cinchona calisaya]|uniref:Uncharacterized protein n=1 Tax=Cinchona calisaya TaxID=153742 RepID=A0ABD2ZAZ8_9GENT